jgi:hypothetical protein
MARPQDMLVNVTIHNIRRSVADKIVDNAIEISGKNAVVTMATDGAQVVHPIVKE